MSQCLQIIPQQRTGYFRSQKIKYVTSWLQWLLHLKIFIIPSKFFTNITIQIMLKNLSHCVELHMFNQPRITSPSSSHSDVAALCRVLLWTLLLYSICAVVEITLLWLTADLLAHCGHPHESRTCYPLF
jgi:hypothetical protein